MSDSKLEEQAPVLDSETSLDYYVTTVNAKPSTKPDLASHLKEEKSGIVVSVDRAGSVKVRKRKKSKRRKKISNLALEEAGVRASDDGILYRSSGSDGSQKKVPRRSASVCEKDLRKNSRVVFSSIPSYNKQLNGDVTSEDQRLVEVVVRKRVKKKTSFKSDRRSAILGDSKPDAPKSASSLPTEATSKHSPMASQDSQPSLSSMLTTSIDTHEPVKKLNRQDALATINAFVMEVQEATTVAKQQEKQEVDRKKDPVRRSHSLSELIAEDTDVSSFDANDSVPDLPESKIQPLSKPPFYGHQKSESIGQRSIVSGSVFLSDHDASVDETPMGTLSHLPLIKTSSDETKGRCKRSHSLFDIVMDANANNLFSEAMSKRVSRNQSAMNLCSTNQCQSRKSKDFDYGIAHLEQVCKLMEQIGDLRNQNQALVKRVQQLEALVKELKNEKGSNSIDSTIPDSYQTLPKRSHPVGRLRDAISRSTSRSRKSSFERPQSTYEMKGSGEPFPLASSFGVSPHDRRTIHSNVQLKKNKPTYSRDDLELSSKGRWKFWKAPAKSIDAQQSSRKRIIPTIKTEQSSASNFKSSNVTLDSLLNNIDSDFSQKMMQWQSSTRPSRAPSRASEVGSSVLNKTNHSSPSSLRPPSNDDNLRFKVHRIAAEENAETTHKQSFRQRLSKWERAAAKRFSLDKRSKSVDRMNALNDAAIAESNLDHHNRTMSARADFHKSMPCVMTASTESRLKQLKRNSVHHSVNSVEWSGLQEAFPTTNHFSGKPLSRLLGASHSRLASPLRKKSSQAHKRRSWSFSKKPSSKYYLPNTGDFTLGSNLELAESIGEQFTLEIDQDDVKGISTGVDDEELNHLKKNTADLRDKLSEIESIYKEPSKPKVRPRPASSLARYHAEPSALSFRRSKHVETLRLSSCEILSTPMSMSPLDEEVEFPLVYHSSPDLCCKGNAAPTEGAEQEANDTRRYTVTVHDLKRPGLKVRRHRNSAPSVFDASRSHRTTGHPIAASLKRGTQTAMNPDEVRKRWDSSRLQHSRSTSRSFVPDSAFVNPFSVTNDCADDVQTTLKKKRSTISGRMLHSLPRMSQKSRRTGSLRKNVTAERFESLQPTKKKKLHRMFSFKDKSSAVKVVYSTEPNGVTKLQEDSGKTNKSREAEQNGRTDRPTKHQQKRRKSEKILEISERLTEDSRSRRDSSPPKIKKGIVSRLSKRFARPNKEEKKTVNSKTTSEKSAVFLNAKNHFETKPNSESKSLSSNANNHNNTHPQLRFNKRSC